MPINKGIETILVRVIGIHETILLRIVATKSHKQIATTIAGNRAAT